MNKFLKSIWFPIALFLLIDIILFILVASNGEVFCFSCVEGTECRCPSFIEANGLFNIILRTSVFSILCTAIIYALIKIISSLLKKSSKS